MKDLWTIEDGELFFDPHYGQAQAWNSERRITAMVAGTQGGKTSFGPWWLWREIQRGGEGDYLAVTATFDLFKLKMLPAIRILFEDVLGIGRYWAGGRVMEIREGAKRTGDFRASYADDPMWGRIILRSADSPGGLESGTAKAAWLDEAGQTRFQLMAWRAIIRRLSLSRGPILITTTLYDLGWVKQQIIDKAKRNGKTELVVLPNGAEIETTDNAAANIKLIQFDSIANPLFSVEEYKAAESVTPDDEFAMFYRGRAAKLRTLIYNVFDDDIHKVPSFNPPREWLRVVGVDPVGAHIAAVWLAYDPNKRQLHLYREYREPFGLATRDHAASILEFSSGERIIKFIGGGPSERQARTDWAAAGLPLDDPPVKDVWAQIRRVYALLKTFALVIHNNCEMTLDEIGKYQRQRDRAGNLTDEIKDKEMYDCLDATRYAVAWLLRDEEQVEWVYRPGRVG